MAHLIPTPYRIEAPGGSPFVLSAHTGLAAPGHLMPLTQWFRAEIVNATGVEIGSGSPENEIRLELVAHDGELSALPETRGLRADDGDAQGERYALVVTSRAATIRAMTPEGLFRGLTSLFQLAATSPSHDGAREIEPVTVLDTARFAWRGFSLDVVRRFSTVEQVLQVIDLLALYKANVLHLHLTDSEGWRLDIDAWPKLAEVAGATAANGRPGGYYTKAEYRQIVAYAAARFITVVPEFDMPGHTAAIYRAYPELAGDGTSAESAHLDKPDWFQVMHPDHPRIFDFVSDVLREIADLTPGAYIHIGGDEALGMDDDLYGRFVSRVLPIVRGLGKKPLGWQEISRTPLVSGDVVQEWVPEIDLNREASAPLDVPEGFDASALTPEVVAAFRKMLELAGGDVERALNQGAYVLLSRASRSYLDSKYGEPSVDAGQEAERARLGMPFYPQVPVEAFFGWDPASAHPLLGEDRIVGVEAAIWCETIAEFDELLFMVLPRLPGVLEKGWAQQADPAEAWKAYRPALAAQAEEWERRGWPYFRAESVWG